MDCIQGVILDDDSPDDTSSNNIGFTDRCLMYTKSK